jgi:hypothetical protein
VKILEITINAKQVIAIIWTVIAIALSLIIVTAMRFDISSVPWYVLVALFFGILLVITLPVYLLVALWGIATKPSEE